MPIRRMPLAEREQVAHYPYKENHEWTADEDKLFIYSVASLRIAELCEANLESVLDHEAYLFRPPDYSYRGNGWKKIRKQVLERDKFKCVDCGAEGRLKVHHIKRFIETEDNSLENLVSLCAKCHYRRHRGIGERLCR